MKSLSILCCAFLMLALFLLYASKESTARKGESVSPREQVSRPKSPRIKDQGHGGAGSRDAKGVPLPGAIEAKAVRKATLGRIEGRIVDNQQNPIPDSRIRCTGPSVTQFVIADSAGQFCFKELSSAIYVLEAEEVRASPVSDEFFSRSDIPKEYVVMRQADVHHVTLRVRAGPTRITGNVLEANAPGGRRVVSAHRIDHGPGSVVAAALLDSSGSFDMTLPYVGRFAFELTTACAEGRLLGIWAIDGNYSAHLSFDLSHGGVSGYLEEDMCIFGCEVYVVERSGWLGGHAPRFAAPVTNSEWCIDAVPAGEYTVWSRGTEPLDIDVKAGHPISGLRLKRALQGTISGRVVGQDASGLAFAHAQSTASAWAISAPISPDGSFTISGAPVGEHAVMATRGNEASCIDVIEVTEGAATDFLLVMQKGTILTLICVDRDGSLAPTQWRVSPVDSCGVAPPPESLSLSSKRFGMLAEVVGPIPAGVWRVEARVSQDHILEEHITLSGEAAREVIIYVQ